MFIGGLQPFEKRAVVDTIKGCGQVKERQHREVAESSAVRISASTLRAAVSVERVARHAD